MGNFLARNKPPRYLLREYILKCILKSYKPGKFLEIGYGAGDMLITLVKAGYHGCAYDSSIYAKNVASKTLKGDGVTEVELIDSFPEDEHFDYIFFFELFGYFKEPIVYLVNLKRNLSRGSHLIFSFTNSRHGGIAEKKTGGMSCFSRKEVEVILEKSGYTIVEIINYGYPLSNIIRPLLHFYFKFKTPENSIKEVEKSGLSHQRTIFRVLGVLVNKYTLLPFLYCQVFFKKTDLGTGYIVVAKKRVENEW